MFFLAIWFFIRNIGHFSAKTKKHLVYGLFQTLKVKLEENSSGNLVSY